MSERSRVQRWREGKRQQGLKAVTVWLTQEEALRLKDVALQWHCSPSAVVQRALAQVTTSPPAQNSIPPDTLQLRELIRAELDAREAEKAPVTDTVTEVITDMLARDLPVLVRQLVEELALEALGFPVTDTNGRVTDTEIPEEEPEPRKVGRPRGAMSQWLVALLREHPEGQTASSFPRHIWLPKPTLSRVHQLDK
jgi:hypothetical protein